MHLERHSIGKVGWLRAAVLGANDGIVSTASLVLGRRGGHFAVGYFTGRGGRAGCGRHVDGNRRICFRFIAGG